MNERKELIGVHARATEKTTGRTREGKIVDETYHTLVIDGKCLIKRNIMLTIGSDVIDGEVLDMRPHDRTKARFKKTRNTRL